MWQDCVILIELDNSFDIFDILFGSTVQPTTKSNAFKLSFDGKGSLSNWGQNTTVTAALGRAKTGQNGLKRQVESGKWKVKSYLKFKHKTPQQQPRKTTKAVHTRIIVVKRQQTTIKCDNLALRGSNTANKS